MFVTEDASQRGGYVGKPRHFVVVLDLQPEVSRSLGVPAKFFRLFQALRADVRPEFDTYLLALCLNRLGHRVPVAKY